MFKIINMHLGCKGPILKKSISKSPRVGFVQKFPTANVLEVSKTFFKLDIDFHVIKL